MKLKEEWESLKLQFASLSSEVGGLEYEKQRKLTEMMILEQKIKDFWETNKDTLSAGQFQKSDLSNLKYSQSIHPAAQPSHSSPQP